MTQNCHTIILCTICFYVACATGCFLCNGPQNSDCLACDNADLYRDTTNMLGAACVTQCGPGTTESTDVFGVRTCIVGGCQHNDDI